MVKYITFLIIFISLTGCAVMQKSPIIQEVKVPVLVCPTPINIDRPILPIEYININTSDEDVVKFYKQSIKILQNYSIQLEKALDVYK